MWINKEDNSIIKEEEMYEILMGIAELHAPAFDPTEMLNELYPSVSYFDREFYAGDIISKLAPDILNECWNQQYEFWVEHVLDDIIHYDFEDGDDLTCLRQGFNFKELKEIVWKNNEGE